MNTASTDAIRLSPAPPESMEWKREKREERREKRGERRDKVRELAV